MALLGIGVGVPARAQAWLAKGLLLGVSEGIGILQEQLASSLLVFLRC